MSVRMRSRGRGLPAGSGANGRNDSVTTKSNSDVSLVSSAISPYMKSAIVRLLARSQLTDLAV